jgi:hypothetical protein
MTETTDCKLDFANVEVQGFTDLYGPTVVFDLRTAIESKGMLGVNRDL